ncbi:NADH dehydrogenase subunit K [Krasilnikovia cinnamomea]|uniref:NADH-quinone oxidoreductase subunit K n=1 Tax=Krasilnikovia cinnamomea TaxID=349313 RepID=A0A4Q7ZLQ5_9ACTN|nr:NADH-quinone oxidoreductase subunit NuoK [Krasilnikovia cinnamomea]RZU51887.1 NADH dehydrogenase subunit K [Krasilnikovia cinnamomea]
MHAVIPMVTAGLLFGLGVYGVLRRRNAILVLMAVELMLNAVNLVFVTADATIRSTLDTGAQHAGAVFTLFVIVLAAAEIGVGLAIVLQFYRLRASVAVDAVELDPAADPTAAETTAGEETPAGVAAGTTATATTATASGTTAADAGPDAAAGTENVSG